GPSTDHVSISASSYPLVTDGTKTLTLTCTATEVNPRPLFSWIDPLCQANSHVEGDSIVCRFAPQVPWDDGQVTTCRVMDGWRDVPVSTLKTFVIKLKYPPNLPVITGETPYGLVHPGDTLTCTVTGGKPPAVSVSFSCDAPGTADSRPGVTTGNAAESSVSVPETALSRTVTCTCRPVWDPDRALAKSSSISTAVTVRPDP
ncbi:hypothetical protein BaRGS_00030715, partial [Batillaria attramentaria]